MPNLELDYDLTVKSRYHYVSVARRMQAQLLRVCVFIHFADTEGMILTVTADAERFEQPIPYDEDRQSGRSATGASGYRHFVYADIQEGLFGSFFDCEVVKNVPATGAVEYEGVQFEVEPDENEPEFSTGY